MKNIMLKVLAVLAASILIFNFSLFLLISRNLFSLKENIENKLSMVVYLDRKLPRSGIDSLIVSIRKLPAVKAVEFTSSEKAYEQLTASIGKSSFPQGLFTENPLPASLRIKVKDSIMNLEPVAKKINLMPGVTEVDYVKEILYLLKIFARIVSAGVPIAGFSILFSIALVISFMDVINLHSKKTEIRLSSMGGRPVFKKGMFVAEGLASGLASGAAGLALVYALYVFISRNYLTAGLPVSVRFLPVTDILYVMGGAGLLWMLASLASVLLFIEKQ